MKDYYGLFIELSLKQCTKNDYLDRQKVKMHNMATKKMKSLQNEMKQIDSKEILNLLLSHDDSRVRLNAASFCLQMGVLMDKAVVILKKIIDESEDSTISFSAKMILKSIE